MFINWSSTKLKGLFVISYEENKNEFKIKPSVLSTGKDKNCGLIEPCKSKVFWYINEELIILLFPLIIIVLIPSLSKNLEFWIKLPLPFK